MASFSEQCTNALAPRVRIDATGRENLTRLSACTYSAETTLIGGFCICAADLILLPVPLQAPVSSLQRFPLLSLIGAIQFRNNAL